MNYKTEQEEFWAGEFGIEYIKRNNSAEYLASNFSFFSKALQLAGRPNSLIEFGANIGMNLQAIKALYPNMELSGIEINESAAKILSGVIGNENTFVSSILDYDIKKTYDVVLIKGVLIHINPDVLSLVYDKLYYSCRKYILVCEYYNQSPVTIKYRGHENKLFKRDFAGELMDRFNDLELVDYGFVWHRDPAFPQDDVTWFLLSKR